MPLPVTFHVQIGFPIDPSERLFILDHSLLDGGDVLAGSTGGFEDVTDRLDGDDLEPIHITHGGRPSPLSDYGQSHATVKFRNDHGDFDSLNLAGEFVTAGVSLVRVERRIWIYVQFADGTIEDRFAGFIKSYTPDISVRGWPTMTVECEGWFPNLSTFDPDAQSPVGEGDDSGARVNRVLDNADVPDGDRSIRTGNATLQETTLAQDPLTECRLVAASESPFGGFFENRHGELQLDPRRAIVTDTTSREPQATFGPPGNGAGVLPYVRLVPKQDIDRLRNDISAARAGGSAQTSQDATSIATFFHRRDKRTDLLLQTDDDVAQWVGWRALLFGAGDEYRYEAIEVDCLACPDSQLTAMAAFLAVSEVRTRIAVLEQIVYRNASDVEFTRTNTREVFIEQIDEWIGWKSWRQTWDVSDAEILGTSYFILDSSLLDGTDVLAPF